MKKMIGGKRYDTASARMIGSAVDAHGVLYCKKTGEYFLYIADGGGTIKPLSYDAALSWASEHLSFANFDKEFGSIRRGEKVQISAWILPWYKKQADIMQCTYTDVFYAGVEALLAVRHVSEIR